jgi:dTDP-4-dehydrorhamnose 3,5-epimerase
MPFVFQETKIPEVILIKPKIFHDERGFFMETYKESEFNSYGIKESFVQDNHSKSSKNVLRGLHFQTTPKAQGKLVRVIQGTAWDVAVDLRKGSPDFLKWVSFELSDKNNHMVYIPPGFAHGFVTLTDTVHLVYKCTAEYDSKCDSGVRYDDKEIGISWPIHNPVVSVKDKSLPYLKDINLDSIL